LDLQITAEDRRVRTSHSRRIWAPFVRVAFVALALGGIATCYLLVHPFVEVIAWAFALAVVTKPLEFRVRAAIKYPGLSSGITVLAVGAALLSAAAFVLYSLAATGAEQIERAQTPGAMWTSSEIIERFPTIGLALRWLQANADLEAEIQRRTAQLGQVLAGLLTGSLSTLLSVFLMLFVLFYFLRDSARILDSIYTAVPLKGGEQRALFYRVHDTVSAVIGGTLVVSAIQGILGGLMFWWFGLGAPVLWGSVMALLSMIPMLGAFVIWGPVAAYLALSGQWASSAILAAWGATAVGCIDNLLYPALVGNRLRFHPLLVFFAVIGGISFYGASGVILGPLTLSITDGILFLLRSELEERPLGTTIAPVPEQKSVPDAHE
jgi:predicted PurR-regulated permease PerM